MASNAALHDPAEYIREQAIESCAASLIAAGEVGDMIDRIADYTVQRALYAAINGKPLDYAARVALEKLHVYVETTIRTVEAAEASL